MHEKLDVDALVERVAGKTTIEDSTAVLLDGILDVLYECSHCPTEINDLIEKLHSHKTFICAAVATNIVLKD
jgi:hypothetical protein